MTREWSPASPALGSTVYLNGMVVGELLSAGMTLPLHATQDEESWRLTLMLWSIPALMIAAILLIPRAQPEATSLIEAAQPARMRWRTPALWQLGLPLASAVVVFLATNAWMESFLARRNEADLLARMMLLYNACPLVASLLGLILGQRLLDHPRMMPLMGAMSVLGLAGFYSCWDPWGFSQPLFRRWAPPFR